MTNKTQKPQVKSSKKDKKKTTIDKNYEIARKINSNTVTEFLVMLGVR
jgi:hypothetical protein